jgi:hypothetical protein
MGQAADFGAGGGVEHGQRAATLGIAPLAVDEELGVGVGHVWVQSKTVVKKMGRLWLEMWGLPSTP